MHLIYAVLPIIIGGVIAAFLDIRLHYKSSVLFFFIGALSVMGSFIVLIT